MSRGVMWACLCGTLNKSAAEACSACGAVRGAPTPAAERRRLCFYDGAPILASGICEDTGGYPYGTPCPFACPHCRATLEWHGGCYTCFGRAHAGDPKTMPGDRYDLFDDTGQRIGDGQHWMLVERGPILALTAGQVRAMGRLVQDILRGMTAAPGARPPRGRARGGGRVTRHSLEKGPARPRKAIRDPEAIRRHVLAAPRPESAIQPGHLRVFVPGPLTNPMNGPRGHWSKHARWARGWRERTAERLRLAFLEGGTRLSWGWDTSGAIVKRVTFLAQTARAWDDDNLAAGMKPMRDALKDVHLIDDDTPSSGHEFVYQQVVNRKERGVWITVEPL